jgi:translation initiation factor 2B subunit (eIF-2B alpha/beta/delta family)
MNKLDNLVDSIKKIKIQGATNIALESIKGYSSNPTKEAYTKLINSRPTEPLLQNSLNILKKSCNLKKDSKKLINYIKKSQDKINKFGIKLIKDDMNILVHCHSSSVISLLKYAKYKKKKFVVYTTETHPLLQGRMSAKELSKSKIPVIHLSDNAINHILDKIDLFLFGADAFTEKGVINKIGTSLYCEYLKKYNIPRYSCGVSLKYSKKIPKIEFRSGKEVWDERQKNIQVINPAFDLTNKKFLTGIVSEFGIKTYKDFIKLSKKNLNSF